MSYAESLNSSKVGQNITKSMENIKLSNQVSPAEVQSMLYKFNGQDKKQAQKTDSFTLNNQMQSQNIQTYQAQPNYQVQQGNINYQAQPNYNYQNYQQAPYQTSQIQAQNYQPQISQAPAYPQNAPMQYQNYQMTNSYPLVQTANNYTASTNAINAYSAQNQPQTSGQNLNVTTQNQAVQ